MREFFDAIKSNDLEKVSRLITNANDVAMLVNQAMNDGWTPLLAAASRGHAEVAGLLLEFGADLNQASNYGCTPLLTAAQNGHTEVAQLLLAADGIQVDKAMLGGITPLMAAAYGGYVAIAQLLLDHGADVNKATDNGCTPLHVAARKGRIAFVQLLLATPGIRVNPLVSPDGWTPLMFAALNRNNNIVALLRACIADGTQSERAFRAVDLSGKKAVIHYHINMNEDLLAAALFKSLEPEERIKLIRAIAPDVNKQYRNLQNFSLVCAIFFKAVAKNQANMHHARNRLSLFDDKKFNNSRNFYFKLPDNALSYMSQFLFDASKNKTNQIMIQRLWRWHNTDDTLAVTAGGTEAGAGFTQSDDFNAPQL